MRICPDVVTAGQDQAAIFRIVRITVESGLSCNADPDRRVRSMQASHLSHPAVVAAAHSLHRATRSGTIYPDKQQVLAEQLRQAIACASHGTQQTSSGDGVWSSVDLAPPQSHLRDSVMRALAVVPARGGDDCKRAGSEVT